MFNRILVIGGTGLLGRPVVTRLTDNGHGVRVLARNVEETKRAFGDTVEHAEGSAMNIDDVKAAMEGCDAAHINLTPATEFAATKNVIDSATEELERIGYVSATTLSEELRWFYRVDVKLRTEELVRNSGIPHVIFRPTWVMETLQNFVRGRFAIAVVGKNPPPLHFFAAADFGRMVAATYDDDRALGKILYIYGPEAITLDEAMERFAAASYPDARMMRLKLWQARLVAKLLRNDDLAEVTELIDYLDTAGEQGDPTEANEILGAPSITLDQWCTMPRDLGGGFPH